MKRAPSVDVVLPAYNSERYVREAIESVLAQRYPSLTLICVDDGSTDSTRAVLDSFGGRIVRVVLAKNQGIAEARNAGIRAGTGEFIAFMDADDVWEEGKIESQVARFSLRPDLDISFTRMRCFVSPELDQATKDARYCPPGDVDGYLPPTAMVRRDSFMRVGMFDPKWRVGEFIDWFSRAKDAGLTHELHDGVYLRRRIHDANTGVVARPSRVDYVRIAREALARKRAKSTDA